MNEEKYAEEFDSLVECYYEAGDPRSQLAALEEVVRLADSVGDVHSGYSVRMEMIQCANFAGQNDKALVAFTWCLAQSDKYPDDFDSHTLLWKYKWILENLPTFRQVKKDKILELQDDMQERLLAAGYNLRPIHYLRWTNAMRMGDFARANQYMEKWTETPRDEMADCEACEQNKLSEYFGRIGEFEESAKVAEKLLDGRMVCAEIPHLTYGHLVATYLKLGRLDEVRANHSKWYRMVNDNEDFLKTVSQHMLFAAGTDQFPEAIAMFERHAPWAAETVNDQNRFAFYNSARFLFQRMSPTGSNLRLNVPDEFAFKREDAQYQCAELAQWFHAESTSLAKQFNQRNGNEYFTKLMAEPEALFS